MSPGFFLDIADNTGDGFSYLLLPVAKVEDIPTNRCYPIVRNVVRSRSPDCSVPPTVPETEGTLRFFNSDNVEIFAQEELDVEGIEDRLADTVEVSESDVRDITLNFHDHGADIRDRTTLSHIDGGILTTINEGDENQEDPAVPPVPTEPVTEEVPEVVVPASAEPIQTTEEPPSKRRRTSESPVDDGPPIITQDSDDYNSANDDEIDQIVMNELDSADDFDTMAARVNVVFDPDEDRTRDLESIEDHRSLNGVLELLMKIPQVVLTTTMNGTPSV